MRKLIRVDMTEGKVQVEELAPEYAALGGRGLTSGIVASEVPPLCHPLDPSNKLVVAAGLLAGTTCANSGRLSIGAKSPLTGGIKESNVGGNVAIKLGKLRIAGMVLEGQAPEGKLFYLLVNKDGVQLQTANEFKGLKNYDLASKLQDKYGKKVGIVSIGPAGEMKFSAASIAVTSTNGTPSRHAGRGGMGAVMGSKGMKAIVVDDTEAPGVTYADKEAFKEAAGVFRDALREHPVTKPGGGLAVYGTNVLTSIINEAGGFPTRNFTEGQFEGAAKISGETMHDVIKERGGNPTHSGCSTCIIQCSNEYVDKDKNYVTSALEYETIWANGANCGIDDLDAIAEIHRDRLCSCCGNACRGQSFWRRCRCHRTDPRDRQGNPLGPNPRQWNCGHRAGLWSFARAGGKTPVPPSLRPAGSERYRCYLCHHCHGRGPYSRIRNSHQYIESGWIRRSPQA
jgi:aldehyde:ferredoxin oxidoreductase